MPLNHIAVENPIQNKIAKQLIRNQDQCIQPYNFKNNASKATCFWLKNLPKLKSTGFFEPKIIEGKKIWGNQSPSGANKLGFHPDRSKIRSRTFEGIAQAMADQWGDYLLINHG